MWIWAGCHAGDRAECPDGSRKQIPRVMEEGTHWPASLHCFEDGAISLLLLLMVPASQISFRPGRNVITASMSAQQVKQRRQTSLPGDALPANCAGRIFYEGKGSPCAAYHGHLQQRIHMVNEQTNCKGNDNGNGQEKALCKPCLGSVSAHTIL